MKDLIALIIILGLITFGMMVTRQHYFENEAKVNSDWRERTYGRSRSSSYREPRRETRPSPALTPQPSPSPSTTP